MYNASLICVRCRRGHQTGKIAETDLHGQVGGLAAAAGAVHGVAPAGAKGLLKAASNRIRVATSRRDFLVSLKFAYFLFWPIVQREKE